MLTSLNPALNPGDLLLVDTPAHPVTIVPCPNGDILLLPAMWPVRLTPDERRELAADLLAVDS
ncbi:hypothetical protein ABZ917_17570 [Nonomuraea wenchangensis]